MRLSAEGLDDIVLSKTPDAKYYWTVVGTGSRTTTFDSMYAACEWAFNYGYRPDPEEREKQQQLLDQFAGLAMQAIISRDGYLGLPESAAREAYEIANAMLKERDKC